MKVSLRIALGIAFLASVFAMSAAFADNVQIDFNHRVDFSQFHTYSWGRVKTASPFYQSRVRRFVNQQLQSKGWQLVPSHGQVVVFATDQVKNEQELETDYMGMGDGFGGGWGWGGWGGMGGGGVGNATTSTFDQRVGDLVIDLFNGQSKKLLWRGMSSEDLSSNSQKNTKSLYKTIDNMFKKFPPKNK